MLGTTRTTVFFFLIATAILLGVAAPWLAQELGNLLYPPLMESAGPALRSIGPVRMDNPASGEAILLIENWLYAFSFLALLVSFAFLAVAWRKANLLPVGSEAGTASDSTTLTVGDDPAMVTQAIPPRYDTLSLAGQTMAIAMEKRAQDDDDVMRTRAQKILSTVALDANGNVIEDSHTTQAVRAVVEGKTIINGRYELDKPLASGGVGIVYKAFDNQLRRTVAVKQLFSNLSNSSHAQRFVDEAHALAALSHPHIVPIYDLILDSDYWFVMEFLPGGSLLDRIQEHSNIDHSEMLEVAIGASKGLAAAHKRGFIHRDIKPANILFCQDDTAKIADFGIAKSQDSTLQTTVGVVLGSPAYLSPEQAAGSDISNRTDIYSLGVTLYHALTGELPFEGDARELLVKHINKEPEALTEINPDLPESLSSLVLSMLEKKPEDRPDAETCVAQFQSIQRELM